MATANIVQLPQIPAVKAPKVTASKSLQGPSFHHQYVRARQDLHQQRPASGKALPERMPHPQKTARTAQSTPVEHRSHPDATARKQASTQRSNSHSQAAPVKPKAHQQVTRNDPANNSKTEDAQPSDAKQTERKAATDSQQKIKSRQSAAPEGQQPTHSSASRSAQKLTQAQAQQVAKESPEEVQSDDGAPSALLARLAKASQADVSVQSVKQDLRSKMAELQGTADSAEGGEVALDELTADELTALLGQSSDDSESRDVSDDSKVAEQSAKAEKTEKTDTEHSAKITADQASELASLVAQVVSDNSQQPQPSEAASEDDAAHDVTASRHIAPDKMAALTQSMKGTLASTAQTDELSDDKVAAQSDEQSGKTEKVAKQADTDKPVLDKAQAEKLVATLADKAGTTKTESADSRQAAPQQQSLQNGEHKAAAAVQLATDTVSSDDGKGKVQVKADGQSSHLAQAAQQLANGAPASHDKPADAKLAVEAAKQQVVQHNSDNADKNIRGTTSHAAQNALQQVVHQAVAGDNRHTNDVSQHSQSAGITATAASAPDQSSLTGGQGQNHSFGQQLSQGQVTTASTNTPAKADANLGQLSMNNPNLSSELNEKVNYLVSNKLQAADIRLDPAHLGSMQIRLNLQHDQAQVHIHVQNPQAREMLEQTLPKLRDMLAQQGIQLGQSQISQQQSGQQQSQGQTFAQSGQGGGHSFGASGTMTSAEFEADEMPAQMSYRRPLVDDGIDYYA